MKTYRLFLALTPLFLLCSCATSDRKVIATKRTTLRQRTIVAEYPVTTQDKDSQMELFSCKDKILN